MLNFFGPRKESQQLPGCPRRTSEFCGGKSKIIAAIEEPAAIERILTHLGLLAQPPPQTPARRFDLFQAA